MSSCFSNNCCLRLYLTLAFSIVDAAHALGYGEKYSAIPKGTPGAGKDVKWNIEYTNSKAQDVLGLKFRSKEETTKDTVEDYKARGWI